MKKEKVLDLHLLNDTAAACLWYYGHYGALGSLTPATAKKTKTAAVSQRISRIFGTKSEGDITAFDSKYKMKDLLIYALLNGYIERYIQDFHVQYNTTLITQAMLDYYEDDEDDNYNISYQSHCTRNPYGTNSRFFCNAIDAFDRFYSAIRNYSDTNTEADYDWWYYSDTKYSNFFKVLWFGVTQFDILKMFKYITKKYLAAKAEALDKADKSQLECYIPLKSGEYLAIRNPKYFDKK